MKNLKLFQGIFFLILISSASLAQSQEEIMAMAQPGPKHERLEQFAGEWNVEFNYYPVPGGDAIVGNGTAVNEMIIGGRFLQVNVVMDFMDKTMSNMQILGFDKRINKYTIFGIDEFGTYWVTAEGTYDKEKNQIIYTGTDSLSVPGQEFNFKFINTLPENNKYSFEVFFASPEGNWMKMVEVNCKRKD